MKNLAFALLAALTLNFAFAAEPPDVASPKKEKDGTTPQAGFVKRHEGFVAQAKKGECDFLLMGDSITDGWNGKKPIYEKAFGAYKPLNFGIGGDRTQHVLWRMENGEFDGIKPKVMMLMIGTNNTGGDTAEAIAKGITAIVELTRKKSPTTKVLLLAVFPRGASATNNPARVKIKAINEIIAKLDDGGKTVKFLDIGDKFLEKDGTLTKEIMPDFLHLSNKGYEIWAEAVGPTLKEMMEAK